MVVVAPARWRIIDPDIANTNGPAVGVIDGSMTLIIGDPSAVYFSYPYDPTTGTVGVRSVFGDTSGLEECPTARPSTSTAALWCALVGGAQLARFTSSGLDRTLLLPVTNPTDVTFGGPSLDRLYVVSIGSDANNLDGALLVIDGLDTHGRAEPRCTLDLRLV